jgi:hypothetical protein
MEVGELLVALVVIVIIASSWWSWHYQKMVVALLQPRPTPRDPELDLAAAPVQFDQIERVDGRPISSVLGWEAFSISSTLLFEGTVLVSCTRQSNHPAARGRFGHDGSLVLLIGDDKQAGRAFRLIEDWRAAGTTLRLRPTPLASAIELYDRRDNALRADLLAI